MRRVLKIGGSLLLRRHLPQEIATWLAGQSPAETLCIVGGGQLIDAIRNLDSVRPADAAVVHWRCVALLRTTFACCADWFADWPQVRTPAELDQALQRGFAAELPTLVAVDAFYSPHKNSYLPLDWRTTTDALAGVLAIESAADELVLLKSCAVDPSHSLEQLTVAGIVDPALESIADQIANLRVEGLPDI